MTRTPVPAQAAMNTSEDSSESVERKPGVIALRIRRRTLCIALAVPLVLIAVGLALFFWQFYQAARVTAAIEARGGYVYTNYYSGRLPTSWAPWLGRQSGAYTSITLDNCHVTDNWLAAHDLSRLSGKLMVDLSGNPVTDESLRRIAHYRRLSFLHLSSTQITDDGLLSLRDCKDLGGLYLADTAVTDAGLAHLDGMPQLNALYVQFTQVTAAGILHALRTFSLRFLSIDASLMTPELATTLGNESLNQLELHGDATPEALSLLANAAGIESLTLYGDSVTDECVPDLSRLTGLKYLYLTNCRITRDGYNQLRKALPVCEIYETMNSDVEETE